MPVEGTSTVDAETLDTFSLQMNSDIMVQIERVERFRKLWQLFHYVSFRVKLHCMTPLFKRVDCCVDYHLEWTLLFIASCIEEFIYILKLF